MTFAVPAIGRLSLMATHLAATHLGIDPQDVFTTTRQRKAAFARHLAIYLAHVGCGMRVTDVARAFQRDPATIRYACAKIEDARDDLHFDQGLTALEDRARHAAEACHETTHMSGGCDHEC
jgi:Bacterial dnaA protein helix-turn-helix